MGHAQRVRLVGGATILALAVIWSMTSSAASVGATGQAARVALTPNTPNRLPSVLGTPVHPYPDGVPMIHVRLAQPPGPSFTAADVAPALQTYRMIYQQPGSPPLHVTSVTFLTSERAGQRLDIYTGRPPDALMCLLGVSGDFVLPTAHPGGSPAYLHHGQLLLDAVTGNVIVERVLFV